MLKTNNLSDIEQLGIHTVKLRHRDKSIRYIFLVGLGDSPTLLGMSDSELLSILRTIYDIIGEPHESKTFDSPTIEMS